MEKEIKNQDLNTRRSFLKKAAYAAPAIVALGSMTKPAYAGGSCCKQDKDPYDGDHRNDDNHHNDSGKDKWGSRFG